MMNKRGFTLIELMIVVVIIGILAAIALPRFSVSSYKAKEKEAELILKHVFTMQEAYHAHHGAYAGTVNDLVQVGFQPPARLENYIWAGDASTADNACLASNGPHASRRVRFADGVFSDC
jgi:prepilin-type N-terminal cleavage/methylation domain-containing protein